ncbi:N-acetylmuramoyl-L-alanine amidase [Desulfosarcina sp. OttesenSCG-928-B08]|nr:N-acetylmuramoyl-L-alanine amidase [Desulfosarcina sp. OttesenSCG-928-B08]
MATVLLWGILVGMGAAPASAITPKDQYHQAEQVYAALKKSPANQKDRNKWLTCIKSYQKVYQLDPNGKWAAAGLYNAGRVYGELYRALGRAADQEEAAKLLGQVIKKFPKSAYTPKARAELAALKNKKTTAAPPAGNTPAKTTASNQLISTRMKNAHAAYIRLIKDEKRKKYRDQWEGCIKGFEDVYAADPKGPHAAECLYMTGLLYKGLAAESKREDDRNKAANCFRKVRRLFPDSVSAVRAADELGVAAPPSAGSPTTGTPTGPEKTNGTGLVTVEELRFWSNPSYTRIVVNMDRETRFTHHLLKKDPAINKPQRLYVDLAQSRLGNTIQKTIPINDDLLSDARAGQYTMDSVRIVVDIKSFKHYKIFSLNNPFRIVLDIWGVDPDSGSGLASAPPSSPSTSLPPTVAAPPPGGKVPPGAIARQLALGVRRIVIDPGHGGKDYGAPGYKKGVHEKQVTLEMAKRLAKKVEKELGCEVILTRTTDRYLTLEERTAIANTKNADLFISIHTNAVKDARAYGIETYFLNLATDDEAIRVAARENATSTKNISDLESILNDLMQNAKINESSRLATLVQSQMCTHLQKNYSDIRNKGVKQAPFYVLLGAQMPAVLVETAFISNARECDRLTSAKYQEAVCDGIIRGIRQYIQDTTAFADPAPTGKKKG